MTDTPLIQSQIAERVGVTQPRVAQVRNDLRAWDLVERIGRRGWCPADPIVVLRDVQAAPGPDADEAAAALEAALLDLLGWPT